MTHKTLALFIEKLSPQDLRIIREDLVNRSWDSLNDTIFDHVMNIGNATMEGFMERADLCIELIDTEIIYRFVNFKL